MQWPKLDSFSSTSPIFVLRVQKSLADQGGQERGNGGDGSFLVGGKNAGTIPYSTLQYLIKQ